MIYRKDNYYDDFVCIADRCPMSCCLGWQIVIDEESMERYEQRSKEKDSLGQKLQNGIDWEEACFLQCDGRCSMLREDLLCHIQAEEGENALSFTCRSFPRHTEEFEDEREYSLSLSCPEAARMILNASDPFSYTEWEDESFDEDFEEFDFLMYSKLLDAREALFSMLGAENLSLKEALFLTLCLGRELQLAWDDGDLDHMDHIVDEMKDPASLKNRFPMSWDAKKEKEDFSILFTLENLEKDWPDLLNQCWERDAFTMEELGKWEEAAGKQILRSLLFTYFLGAVYDDMIYAKLALAVYSVKWIVFLSAEGAGEENLIQICYRYCREIEHSDLNLDALEEFFDSRMEV